MIDVIGVKRHFIPNPDPDQYGNGHTRCQPDDVDGRVELALPEKPPGDGKIIAEHKLFCRLPLLILLDATQNIPGNLFLVLLIGDISQVGRVVDKATFQ